MVTLDNATAIFVFATKLSIKGIDGNEGASQKITEQLNRGLKIASHTTVTHRQDGELLLIHTVIMVRE